MLKGLLGAFKYLRKTYRDILGGTPLWVAQLVERGIVDRHDLSTNLLKSLVRFRPRRILAMVC